MNTYILYSKRSCLTGKELFNSLNLKLKGITNIRRVNNKMPKKKPDILIRWGCSSLDFDCEEINKKESVTLASDKGKMMEILSKTEGVTTPPVVFRKDLLGYISEDESLLYFRNKHDHIVLRKNWIDGDKYALLPINKIREFRVHIFGGKTLGVYEKIPESDNVKIYKSENCNFVRIDMNLEENRRAIRGVRPMAKLAVEALGLDFAGVDVIIDNNNTVYVLEVNSSPSLNTLNIERFSDAFVEKIKELKNGVS